MVRGKTSVGVVLKRLCMAVAAAAAVVLLCAYQWAPLAKLLSGTPPTMHIAFELQGRVDEPECNIVRLTFRSEKAISSVSIRFHFDTPVRTAVVIYSLPSGKYKETTATYDFDKPCVISTKSNGGDGPLKFAWSSDGYDLFVSGNNVVADQDQTFIGGILHNSPEKADKIAVIGKATYVSFGHELPARVVWVDAETGGQSVISDDAP